jgi:methionyl-tRNA synthetase
MDAEKAGDIQTHFALEKIWGYITRIDQFIDASAPWTMAKEGRKAELSAFLSTLVECVRQVTILVLPFMPNAAAKIWQAFGFEKILPLVSVRFDTLAAVPLLKSDHRLAADKLIVFPRIEISAKENAVEKALTPAPAAPPVGTTSGTISDGLIDIADFQKLDLRVATVTRAEKVEKADKLLRLEIDLGGETRQIIAGIAAHYTPEQMVGKSIIVVANLKPAKIRGVESRGMLLAAKSPDGALALIVPEKGIASNSKVG